MGVDNGIIKKSGSRFTYEGDQLGQGKEKVRMLLKNTPELADEIEEKILKKLKVGKYANLPDEETTNDSVDSVPDVDFDDNADEQQAE